MDSSDASVNSRMPEAMTCRLAWRRSRWLMAALCALGIATCGSLGLSGLPAPACIGLGVAAAGWIAWLLWKEASQQAVELAWIGSEGAWRAECAGDVQALRHVGTTVRGSLAVLTLADDGGGIRRYVWWPDTLDAGGRRTLRLASMAARAHEAARAGS